MAKKTTDPSALRGTPPKTGEEFFTNSQKLMANGQKKSAGKPPADSIKDYTTLGLVTQSL